MDPAAVAAIAALDDGVRRALYEHVRGARGPVTREAAAEAVGISRKLAAFHLDKLVDLGLLSSRFDSAGPRRVGRAPRVYEPAGADFAVNVPSRSPQVLAEILLDAVVDEGGAGPAREAAVRIAHERGRELGRRQREHARGGRIGVERALRLGTDLLRREGYEPYPAGAGVRLRNCPFHPLTGRAPEFVCGMNRAYVDGMVEGLGAAERLDVLLAPGCGDCCVEVRPAGATRD